MMRSNTKDFFTYGSQNMNQWGSKLMKSQINQKTDTLAFNYDDYQNMVPLPEELPKSQQLQPYCSNTNSIISRWSNNGVDAQSTNGWERLRKDRSKSYVDAKNRFEMQNHLMGSISFTAFEEEVKQFAMTKEEMGNRYMIEKNYDMAIDCYSTGLENAPWSTALYNGRSQAFLQLGQFEKARADCDQALSIDCDQVKVLLRRAKLNIKLSCCKDADTDLQRVLILQPNNIEAKNLIDELRSNCVLPKAVPNRSPSERHILKATKYNKRSSPKLLEQKELNETDYKDMFFRVDCEYPKLIEPIHKSITERVKRPLFPICVKVVGKNDDDIAKKKRFDSRENDQNNSSVDGGQLIRLFSQLSFSNLPNKAKTAAQFAVHWSRLRGDPELFSHYLKQMSAEDYSIFQDNMECPMLADILDALIWEFLPRQWDTTTHLEGLLKVPCFGNLMLLMNEKDRANARKLISLCPEAIKTEFVKYDI